MAVLTVCCVIFDKISGNIPGHTIDVRYFISESNTIKLIGMFKQLGSESCCDELCILAQLVNHVSYGLSMLGIQSLFMRKEIPINYQIDMCSVFKLGNKTLNGHFLAKVTYLIDFIEKIEGCWIAFLNGEN